MQCEDNSSLPAKVKEDHELINAAVTLLNGALKGDTRASMILSTSGDHLAQTGNYKPGYSRLTRRQKEVLSMLNEGISCEEICRVMRIEPSTLRDHKAAICNHYGARPIARALEKAHLQGDVPMLYTST